MVTLASFVMRFVELSVPKTATGAHDFAAVRKVGTSKRQKVRHMLTVANRY